MNTPQEPTQTPVATPQTEAPDEAGSLAGYAREAWSQALVAVNDTSEEVQKILDRAAGWAELGPEEARRLAVELTDKLKHERDLLEATLETAVRRAITPFRLPSRDEVAALDGRLTAIELRIDQLLARRAHG